MTTVDFVMPSLGADMDSGRIVEWVVNVGDPVERGDIMAVVETDKSDIEIEVWETGVVDTILAQPGDTVDVGTPLAQLRVSTGESESTKPTKPVERSEPPAPAVPSQKEESPVAASPTIDEIFAPMRSPQVSAEAPTLQTNSKGSSPKARRIANELGIDLASLEGTGPGGAVVAADVSATPTESEVESPAPAPAPDPMRQAIAQLLARSKREIPHYYLAKQVDLEAAFDWLEKANNERPMAERILPAAVLLSAVAKAAAQQPEFNGYWQVDRFIRGRGVHLGVAVSLRKGGLVAPAIHDADQLGIDELMASLRDLVGRARSGRLRGSEMADPTITVSNLGDRGVDVVYGVIYPPQVALIGIGTISTRAAAIGDSVVPRRQVTITLAGDHRATDGQSGSRFLNTIDHLLQTPEDL